MQNNLYLDPKSAKEFSDSRYAPWQGWLELLPYFNINIEKKPLHSKLDTYKRDIPSLGKVSCEAGQKGFSFLDIGSGNGRFLKFLLDQKVEFESYTGIDYSPTLLDISRDKFDLPNVSFYEQDFTLDTWQVLGNKKFDIIVGFGVTHHLESEAQRNNFFANIKSHLADQGLVILSFWQFWDIVRLMKNAVEISPNLYELTFGNDGAKRICYKWEERQVGRILNDNDLDIKNVFEFDLNKYYVVKPFVSFHSTPS